MRNGLRNLTVVFFTASLHHLISRQLRYKSSFLITIYLRTLARSISFSLHFKGRDTRCDKSLRHVAATDCCNKSPRVTCENHRRCDRILSLRSVARIQTGLNSCDISQRQTKRKRLVAAAVQTRRRVAATYRRDLTHRVSRP